MTNETWRDRLAKALAEKNLTPRAASLKAGLAHGYVHSILKEGKEPGIERLTSICQANEISLVFVLVGVEMTPETERLIRLAEQNPEARANLVAILSARSTL